MRTKLKHEHAKTMINQKEKRKTKFVFGQFKNMADKFL